MSIPPASSAGAPTCASSRCRADLPRPAAPGTLFDQLNVWLPRAQLHFDYRKPARLDELLDVEVWVGRIGNSSIRLEFDILLPDGEMAMVAYLVLVTTSREWPPKPVSVPQELRDAMTPYRKDLAV
jgi:acyl-CoA thioesterase FadM